MPGLNGDHWFAPDQLQIPPSEPVVDSTSVSGSTDSDAATVPSDDPESNLDTATTSYNQSDLVLKLTSSLIPRRIFNHGRTINHDALKSTQFAWSTMLLVVIPFPPSTTLPSKILSLLPPCVLNSYSTR